MVDVEAATRLIGAQGRHPIDAFEGRRLLIAYYFMRHRPTGARSMRGLPGLHRRCTSCPNFILATSPSPRSAQGPYEESARYRNVLGW